MEFQEFHPLHEDELIQLLEHTPDLVELSLFPADALTADVMSRLTYRQAPCLVPRLRHLHVWRSDKFDSGNFLDMIESRWKLGSNATDSDNRSGSAISRIQTVQLDGAHDFDQLALVCCRQLLAEGLDLQLRGVEWPRWSVETL